MQACTKGAAGSPQLLSAFSLPASSMFCLSGYAGTDEKLPHSCRVLAGLQRGGDQKLGGKGGHVGESCVQSGRKGGETERGQGESCIYAPGCQKRNETK